MKHIITTAIVLSRTDFGEADRILTILTPDNGKLTAIAKGVRRSRSKLAGGIELLSVSQVTYLPGRGEVGTLRSARLEVHFGNIVKDIRRTMLAYELLKIANRVTESGAGEEYFNLVRGVLAGLNASRLDADISQMWFYMQLLRASGHVPRLYEAVDGTTLAESAKFIFDFEAMAFAPHSEGAYQPGHIKLLRVALSAKSPLKLLQLQNSETYIAAALQLSKSLSARQLAV